MRRKSADVIAIQSTLGNCVLDWVFLSWNGQQQQDVDLLDNFMRSKEEFNPGDLVIVDDNMDEDSRDYVRYEILTKYNEGRYSSVYIAAKQTCKSDEETLDKTLYALKAGIRKESKNTKLRFKRELAVLRELNGAAAAHSPRLFDSGLVCGRTFIDNLNPSISINPINQSTIITISYFFS
ncbi:unnamed protein product [Nippostrongylus brasiliensis]|uniref:DDE_5 domain-containing protein n=1 Tax=Nippostrongylus brasiliensis TaxID=27835 RepID=A0A0N4XQ69_NIPBR|nr:unnamed protein product [Nippostrongylus brasiliensis]